MNEVHLLAPRTELSAALKRTPSCSRAWCVGMNTMVSKSASTSRFMVMQHALPQRLVFTALLSLAACGGNVVVDTQTVPIGSGGASTQIGAGASTTGTATTDPNNCAGIPDPMTLGVCAGRTTGPPGNCDLTYCDPQENKWEEICVNGNCQCLRNGVSVCNCTLSNLPEGCTGNHSCCFGTTQ
jgi:hypothetical protein